MPTIEYFGNEYQISEDDLEEIEEAADDDGRIRGECPAYESLLEKHQESLQNNE